MGERCDLVVVALLIPFAGRLDSLIDTFLFILGGCCELVFFVFSCCVLLTRVCESRSGCCEVGGWTRLMVLGINWLGSLLVVIGSRFLASFQMSSYTTLSFPAN